MGRPKLNLACHSTDLFCQLPRATRHLESAIGGYPLLGLPCVDTWRAQDRATIGAWGRRWRSLGPRPPHVSATATQPCSLKVDVNKKRTTMYATGRVWTMFSEGGGVARGQSACPLRYAGCLGGGGGGSTCESDYGASFRQVALPARAGRRHRRTRILRPDGQVSRRRPCGLWWWPSLCLTAACVSSTAAPASPNKALYSGEGCEAAVDTRGNAYPAHRVRTARFHVSHSQISTARCNTIVTF